MMTENKRNFIPKQLSPLRSKEKVDTRNSMGEVNLNIMTNMNVLREQLEYVKDLKNN